MAYNEEGSMSKFNAGLLQMSRIHILQERINQANLNPLALTEMGLYNYEIIIASCSSLFQEAAPKLSDEENRDILRLKKAIEDMLKKNPIHSIKVKKFSPDKKYIDTNYDTWDTIKPWLFDYESKIRKLLDKHNLNSPSEDDDFDGL